MISTQHLTIDWAGVDMILAAVHLYIVFAARTPQKRPPQVKARSEAASVRRFVQSFYDWYGPAETHFFGNKAAKDPEEIALTSRAEMFTPELRRLLLEDYRANQEADGYEVGIGYMPFFGAQDFCEHYSLPWIKHEGRVWMVEVRGVQDAQYTGAVPDLNVEVVKSHNRYGWRFSNFVYDNKGWNLLGDLRAERPELQRELARHKRKMGG